jgi:hypothetical protein
MTVKILPNPMGMLHGHRAIFRMITRWPSDVPPGAAL